MILSFYNLITSKNASHHMKQPYYAYAFMAAIFAFIEGLLFSYFTYDLMMEHATSIEDN